VEVAFDPLPFGGVQVQATLEVDAVFGQLGGDFSLEDAAELLLLPVHDPLDGADGLLGRNVELLLRLFAHPQQVAVVGHADAEKLIEVRAVDGQELDAFEQRQRFVLGFLQYAVVEGEPAYVAKENGVHL